MARIERFSSTSPVPVRQAQLIDPGSFRFSTAGARGLQEIGGVLSELGKRKQAANDSLAINAAGESRELAKLQMQQFMLDNPDPDKWDEGMRKIVADQITTYSSQKLSPDAKANEDIEQQAFQDELDARVQIASTTQAIENDITVSGKNLISIMGSDDGLSMAAADIDKQMELYQAALERKDTKEVADIKMMETLRQGKLTFYENQSKLLPEQTIKDMQVKKKSIGKKDVDEDGLSAKDYSDIMRSAQTELQSRNTIFNNKHRETEQDLHKQFITGTLTKEENDQAFILGKSSVATHKAYDTIIKNKSLIDTDAILAEKWLNGNLTSADIKQAQTEGRLRDSNVVATWTSRLQQGQFNIGMYDRALAKVREVRDNKNKYDSTRLWLLEHSEDLGGQWGDLRNKLETNMNASGDASGPHVSRAHGLVDDYAKNNPEINDGTLESIRRIQSIHDAIDARSDMNPEQMRGLSEAILLPYEQEKAKSWFSRALAFPTKYSPIGIMVRGSKRVRAKKQKVFQSIMLVQPASKGEFNKKVASLKSLFGDDNKEARQFYDRYVDSYEWTTE